MNIIQIVLHIGSILKTLKDVEKAGADLFAGKISLEDLKPILDDFAALVSGGVINIPGLTAEQVGMVVADVEKALGMDDQSAVV